MKKLIKIIAIIVAFIWIISIILFVSTDLKLLPLEEQQKFKEGRSFWEWNSSQGPFSIHYVEKGAGSKNIVFLHGFRAHSYTWKHLIEPLVQQGYHIWALDLIGYGLSDKPDHIIYSVDFFIQQVASFMEAKGIDKAHLVGNSMGGGLALNLAILHPERVESLTLLNALGYPLDLPFYISVGRHVSQIWAPFLGPRIIRFCLKQIVHDSSIISDEQVEAYCLPYRFPGGITASLLTLQQYDNERLVNMSEQYSNLAIPILVIWGDHDKLIPVSHYEKFICDFPQAKCLLIKDCGHIPQEEAPDQVLKAFFEFLKGIENNK